VSLRAKFIEVLAKLLGVTNTLTIVVINERESKLSATGEPIASGEWLEPGNRCSFQAPGWKPNPEIHAYVGEDYIALWDESEEGELLEYVYNETNPDHSPAA